MHRLQEWQCRMGYRYVDSNQMINCYLYNDYYSIENNLYLCNRKRIKENKDFWYYSADTPIILHRRETFPYKECNRFFQNPLPYQLIARRWFSTSMGKLGYQPVCRNEWVTGLCTFAVVSHSPQGLTEWKKIALMPQKTDYFESASLRDAGSGFFWPQTRNGSCSLSVETPDKEWELLPFGRDPIPYLGLLRVSIYDAVNNSVFYF